MWNQEGKLNMKNNSSKGYAILAILFILLSIIVFALPKEKTSTFWIAYAFTAFAFVMQIGIWKTTLGKEKTLKVRFLGLPVLHIGVLYAVLQVIALAVFTLNPLLPVWSATVICSIISGISLVCMFSVNSGINEIEKVESKVQKKVTYIQELQTTVELLAASESDNAIKTALLQLAEKIRFSDPMSNKQLEDIENLISTKIEEIKTISDKMENISEINSLLDERNKKCKFLK